MTACRLKLKWNAGSVQVLVVCRHNRRLLSLIDCAQIVIFKQRVVHRDYFNTIRLILRTPVLFLVLCVAGCSSSKTVFDVPRKMTGVVMMVGNEPFTSLAVRTDESKVYLIKCVGDVRQMLLSSQGKRVEVFYIGIEKKKPVDEIEVVKALVAPN